MEQLHNLKSSNSSGFIPKRILATVILMFMTMGAFGSIAEQKISLTVKNATIKEVLLELNKKNDFGIAFNEKDVIYIGKKITAKFVDTSVEDILKTCFEGTTLNYSVDGNAITIYNVQPVIQKDTIRKKVTISGKVIDAKKAPIVGATIIVEGTSQGTITDDKGLFSIVATTGSELDVSFVGFKSTKIKVIETKTNYTITLEASTMVVDDVVVTGMFNKNKNSFTGSVKTLNIEELKSVSNTNIISAISMLTPGLRLIENNEFGSDPNRLPDIVIRGTSTLTSDADERANQPVIILDGIEITLRDLYDIDINDIERVDVLKDASATALYGEKAANGVIVIERKKILNEKLRLSYNLDGSVDVPDLNTYNYLNAKDKLEFERLAGLYQFNVFDDYEEYNRKKKMVSRGIDTDWLAKPLRSGFSINNSIGVSGRGNNMTYRVNANVKNVRGVMKDDSRDNYGVSTFLSYHIADRITVSYQASYMNTKTEQSPYGAFSDYIKMNPYDAPRDEFGNLQKILSWKAKNPLYEAEIGNFDKESIYNFLNSLSMRLTINDNFFITATGSITTNGSKAEKYISPKSGTFIDVPDIDDKGTMEVKHKNISNYAGNMVLNYSKPIGDKGSMLSLHLGGDIRKDGEIMDGYNASGFYKPELNTPNFAAGYKKYSTPEGEEKLSKNLGVFVSGNFMFRNKYFVDGSFRRSGSSKFGAESKYAPFWSTGVGWNIHNETFAKKDWIETFRLRYSYGVTGNVEFSPYQAITTYIYNNDNYYLHGIGAVPKAMGNRDLTWQSTGMHNVGANIDLFNNRLSVTLDYYIKTTEDMLIDLALPPSVGETSIKSNLGRMRNNGFEFDVSALILSTRNWRFNIKMNGATNANKILKISNALANMNTDVESNKTVAPKVRYEEGQSSTAIYAVQSAGINPATGEEVFINKYGQYTLEYDPINKVVVGDESPTLEGAILPNVSYKGFALSIAMTYRFGGQIYNLTRAQNVENVDPRNNVDQRAYDERWKKVNDVPAYLDIANANARDHIHTSRFVENDNTLEINRIELSYDFKPEKLAKFGFKRLRFAVAANSPFRISTVKHERGTSYPFSRGFSFSICPTF